MRRIAFLLVLLAVTPWTGAQAQSQTAEADEGHLYLGLGASSLALDNNERVPGVATSSPGHTSKLGSLFLGYQFNDQWAADLSFGTDLSDNVDVDAIAVNGYRFFGSGNWKPYLSAGLSNFDIDEAPDDSTQQVQGGFGLSGNLNRNLEVRVGYQHFFTISDESYQDKSIGAMLAWHFRKPEAMPVSEPAPAPEPEPEVLETYELQVQFDFDKSQVKSAYEPQFQEIAAVLEADPSITMTIEGHTCWIGTEQYNLGLSQRRADSVKQKFVDEYGIDPSRIQTEGYGESQPIADNNTLEGRQRNRRAIAVILGPENVTQ